MAVDFIGHDKKKAAKGHKEREEILRSSARHMDRKYKLHMDSHKN